MGRPKAWAGGGGAALGAGSGRAGQRQRRVLHNPQAGARLPGQAGPSRCAGLRWELAVPGAGTFLPQGCQERNSHGQNYITRTGMWELLPTITCPASPWPGGVVLSWTAHRGG